MGKQKESRLSHSIAAKLKAIHGRDLFIFKVHGSQFMMAGLPDLIGCYKGSMFAFETKIPDHGNEMSERQRYVASLMRRAGARVSSPTSVTEALNTFATWFD